MKLILIAGHSRSGKDTIFEMLQKTDPDRYVRVSLADPIRRVCASVIDMAALGRGLSGGASGYFLGQKETEIPFLDHRPTLRSMMQQLGQEWGREKVSTTLWIDIFRGILVHDGHTNSDRVVCVTDVRYQNEVDALDPDMVVKVDRPGNPHAQDPHGSAREIDAIVGDYHILNAGTLKDLQRSAATLHDRVTNLLQQSD